jgi:hypothetical protein
MASLITIILWLVLVMLVLVVLAVVTPVLASVHLTTSPHLSYRVELRALAGLAPRIRLTGGLPKAMAVETAAKPARSKHHKRPEFGRANRAAIRHIPLLIRDILRRIHLVELHVDAEFGLGDPADTGHVYGLLIPLKYSGLLPRSVSLDLRPDFTETCLSGCLTTVFRVTLAALCVPILGFAWQIYGPRR